MHSSPALRPAAATHGLNAPAALHAAPHRTAASPAGAADERPTLPQPAGRGTEAAAVASVVHQQPAVADVTLTTPLPSQPAPQQQDQEQQQMAALMQMLQQQLEHAQALSQQAWTPPQPQRQPAAAAVGSSSLGMGTTTPAGLQQEQQQPQQQQPQQQQPQPGQPQPGQQGATAALSTATLSLMMLGPLLARSVKQTQLFRLVAALLLAHAALAGWRLLAPPVVMLVANDLAVVLAAAAILSTPAAAGAGAGAAEDKVPWRLRSLDVVSLVPGLRELLTSVSGYAAVTQAVSQDFAAYVVALGVLTVVGEVPGWYVPRAGL
jgi:hypothetical protein